MQVRPPTVIARSEATWQSVLPAVGHDREQCLRRIRKSATNLPQRQQACPLSLRGCGLPQVCALVRNDMQKTVTRLRGQGRLPTAIARSEAAGQSASPAVVHSRKQYFRQIRNCYEFAKSTAIFPDFPAGRRWALSVPPAPGQGASSSAPGRRRSRLRFRRRPPPGGRESGWKWDCGQRRSPPPGEKNFPAAGQECG